MEGSAFEIAVYVMRYWFAALMAFLVFRLIRSVAKDWREQRTLARAASSSYAVGMMEVVAPELDSRGKVNPLYGKRYILRRENRIGSARKADWRLNAPGVAPVHASVYQKGDRILLSDCGTRAGVLLNGRKILEDTALFDGDVIGLGSLRILMHISGASGEHRPPEDLYYAPPFAYEQEEQEHLGMDSEEEDSYDDEYEEYDDNEYDDGEQDQDDEDYDDEEYGDEDQEEPYDDEEYYDEDEDYNEDDENPDESSDEDEDDDGYLQRKLTSRGRFAVDRDFAKELYDTEEGKSGWKGGHRR